MNNLNDDFLLCDALEIIADNDLTVILKYICRSAGNFSDCWPLIAEPSLQSDNLNLAEKLRDEPK